MQLQLQLQHHLPHRWPSLVTCHAYVAAAAAPYRYSRHGSSCDIRFLFPNMQTQQRMEEGRREGGVG